MNIEKKALTSWYEFSKVVMDALESGMSETDISELFSNKVVNFEGKISAMKLDEEFAPGIGLNMEPATLSMSKGRKLRADYIFLNIEENKDKWRECKEGKTIQFKAKISKVEGPFNEIEIFEDEDEGEVSLMPGFYDCELIKITS